MVPATADESFADFIYNFAIDEKLQVSRIVFPLPYYTMDKKEHIEKKDWKHDPLFSQLDSYTVLFDKAVDMEAEKDTTATSVKIEWIYLKTNKIKRYYFERLKGLWKLEAIDFADMPENEDSKESFYEFYEHFANDSPFQPVLPREFLTNVNYGQNENSKSNTKVIEIKGFGNGFNNTLYFERRNGLWKLVQFEDLSD